MKNNQLTFKEFRHLPRSEQNNRYKELSDHDKFLARMNDWTNDDPNPDVPDVWEPSEKEVQEIMEIFNRESSE
ncbi:hypothetical protein [Anaeromassilibacillus senegalensis]|uniref:hypothetical protein n=1 Tax=Anaeromassilibacillus senegalensis TaxID=1673717 RepID=UPI000680514E|nr:hypothetical protein [Anaeromassilibacillus senegalensis]